VYMYIIPKKSIVEDGYFVRIPVHVLYTLDSHTLYKRMAFWHGMLRGEVDGTVVHWYTVVYYTNYTITMVSPLYLC